MHASPRSPEEWDYLVSEEDGLAGVRRLRHAALLHRPLAPARRLVGRRERARTTTAGSTGRRPRSGSTTGRRYLINVGSVGQPRDRDPRACYAIWDREARLGDDPARRLRSPGGGARRSSPRACRARWPIASRMGAEPARGPGRPAARAAVLVAGRAPGRARVSPDRLGRAGLDLARPGARLGSPAPEPRRAAGRLAGRHRVLPRAAALARPHVPALQRDPVADDLAAHRGARRVLRPLPGRRRGRGGVAPGPARRRPAPSRWRPRSGWWGSGCAAGSWAASPGGCSATRSTPSCR